MAILTHLVGSRISETGEQREKTRGERGGGLVLEDDCVELRGICDLQSRCQRSLLYGEKGGRQTLPWLLINLFAMVSTC